MRRNISTRNKKGFSLIELCIVIGLLAILAGSITPVFIKRVQVKAGEKTAQEMSVIQQAALSYFTVNATWPANLATLKSAGYLNPSWVTNNPWQNPYVISSSVSSFTVSTSVPETWTALVARDLPTSSIAGTTVSSSVPAPGTVPDESLPVGAIIMWSGTLSSIPTDWQLCDGTNGTPDLRGRFIMSVSSGENPGATGGTTTHTHTFSAIAQANYDHWAVRNDYQNVGVAKSDHTHSISGTTAPAVNLPPYYKLAFIMKMQ